jgi:hypothetical protein
MRLNPGQEKTKMVGITAGVMRWWAGNLPSLNLARVIKVITEGTGKTRRALKAPFGLPELSAADGRHLKPPGIQI